MVMSVSGVGRRAPKSAISSIASSGSSARARRLPVAEPARREEGVEAALQAEPRPGAAQVDQRLPSSRSGCTTGSPSSDGSRVDAGKDEDGLAMVLGREGLVRGDVPAERERAQLLRRGGHVVAPGRQHVSRASQRVEDSADHHHRADRVRLELERGDDAEVAAGAAHGPEEVLVLGRARPAQLAVGGDDVDREQVVDREAVLAAQVADAAVQRQAGDARRRDDAARDGEPEQLRLAVAVAPESRRPARAPSASRDRRGRRASARGR